MRKAEIKRKTKETEIQLSINLDGKGKSSISTPFGMLTHMLEQISKHHNIRSTNGLSSFKIQPFK